MAAIREAKNALAVEGELVGLRRFAPDADGAPGWDKPVSIPSGPNGYSSPKAYPFTNSDHERTA